MLSKLAAPGQDTTEPSTSGERPRPLAPRTRRLIAAVVGVIVIIAALSSLIILTDQSKDKIKIGVMIGPSSTFSHSTEVKAALEMAVNSINKWGGIGLEDVELVIKETLADNASVSAAFAEIEETHHPLFYVTIGCELISLLGPLVEDAKVPLVGMGLAPELTEGFNWTFRFYVSADGEAAVATNLLRNLEVTSLGVLYSMNPHGCGVNDALVDEFSAAGGAVESDGFESEEDLYESISNLLDNEAIFAVGSCSEIGPMISDIKNHSYEGHILVASCGSIPQMWELPQMEGVYVSAPLIYREENIYAREFMESFENTYAITPTHHGAVAYDILYLVQGLMIDHDLTRENLKEQLDGGFIFSGVVGILRIDAGEHDFDLSVFSAVISEGGLRYL
ncbi:MAG: ABC transporter substrate-binding protein [Methanobacteriota archaeon]|nr:MAG: ABC transporter substrate-binding protein [Euryarchaeota archaeon]